MTSFILSAPEYEIPTILRSDQPFNQPNNPRIDYINESSAANYKRYLDRKLKTHLNSDLVRDFNVEAFGKWIDFYTDENIHSKGIHTILNNVSDILGKSMDLQSYVNFRSGLIVKELALFDMRLKQINVLDKAINNIKMHEGNIYTNLGNNDQWKEAMDEVTLYAESSDSDYSTKWSSLCEILQLQTEATKKPISSKKIKKPSYSKMYNQRDLIISGSDGAKSDSTREFAPPVRNSAKLQKALASIDENKEIKSSKTKKPSTKKKGREEVDSEQESESESEQESEEDNEKPVVTTQTAPKEKGLGGLFKNTVKKYTAPEVKKEEGGLKGNKAKKSVGIKREEESEEVSVKPPTQTAPKKEKKKAAAPVVVEAPVVEAPPSGFLEKSTKKMTRKRKHKHNH